MSSQPNQSLIDGLACLQLLASVKEPIGGSELARRLELNGMRANRLLKTLANIGLAQQNKKSKYSIGPGIHTLTAQALFGSNLLNKILPEIKKISHTGMTIAVGVLWREHVTYLFHGVIGEDLEKGLGQIGLYPFHKSSIGMLLLSHERDEYIKNLLERLELGGDTEELFTSIKKIRKDKFALVKSENKPPHFSLALPIANPVVASIAISGIPTTEDITPYINELRDTIKRIEL